MVADNEFMVAADEDALTVAEVFQTLMDAIYSDMDTNGSWTNRQPMISSFDRNLQAEMANRLVGLSTGKVSQSREVRSLALYHTRQLYNDIGELLDDSNGLDTYSLAHLQDLHERLGKALDAVYTM